jgi:ceramide glucosyltransferase
LRDTVPISILKPLAGIDDGLEENLRTFFEQDYPDFEILFAVRNAGDPAIAVTERLCARYPGVASRLIVTGEPPHNAQRSLDRMLAAATAAGDVGRRHTGDADADGDSNFRTRRWVGDVSVMRGAGAEFLNTEAVAERQTIGGVLVARMLDGMKFAHGTSNRGARARRWGSADSTR